MNTILLIDSGLSKLYCMPALLFLFIITFTNAFAQQQSQAIVKGKPIVTGVTIKGNTATLQQGYSFRKVEPSATNRNISPDKILIVDQNGRAAITITCFCNDPQNKGGTCAASIKGATLTCKGSCGGECLVVPIDDK